MDPVKIAGVAEWPTPSSKKEFSPSWASTISTAASSRISTLHVDVSTSHGRTPHAVGGSREIGLRGHSTRVISAPIWYSRTRLDPSESKPTAPTLRPEPSSHNNLRRRQVASSSLLLQKSQCGGTEYEIHDRNASSHLSSGRLRHFLEGPTTRSKFGRTTRT